MTKGRVIGLSLGVFLILAAFGIVLWQGMNMPTTSIAFAQAGATPTTAPTKAPSTAPQPQTIGDSFWAALAAKLGVSADDLKKQAVETRKEMIDQAVKDGRITQEQANAIKDRINSNNIIAPIPLPRVAQGNPPGRGFGPFGNRNPGRAPNFGNGFPGMIFARGMFGGGLQEIEALAKVLKLDAKALITQMAQGKTLAEISKAQGVDEAAVKQALIDVRKAQIDQLLAYGLISQVQADQLKAQLTPDKIDLTRPFWFQFHKVPTAPGSSQLVPDFGMVEVFGDLNQDTELFGEAFGVAPDDMPLFGAPFGAPDGGMMLPQSDIQTQ
ncbi:MAG: DUF2680 domain-containing protein [Chloroflexi bacterium]|nr:DUF2680 domain-containing protein [Chloroflexota bacterium]